MKNEWVKAKQQIHLQKKKGIEGVSPLVLKKLTNHKGRYIPQLWLKKNSSTYKNDLESN